MNHNMALPHLQVAAPLPLAVGHCLCTETELSLTCRALLLCPLLLAMAWRARVRDSTAESRRSLVLRGLLSCCCWSGCWADSLHSSTALLSALLNYRLNGHQAARGPLLLLKWLLGRPSAQRGCLVSLIYQRSKKSGTSIAVE